MSVSMTRLAHVQGTATDIGHGGRGRGDRLFTFREMKSLERIGDQRAVQEHLDNLSERPQACCRIQVELSGSNADVVDVKPGPCGHAHGINRSSEEVEPCNGGIVAVPVGSSAPGPVGNLFSGDA